MPFSLIVQRPQPAGHYHTTNGLALVKRLDAYLPPLDFGTTPSSVISASFTPTATSITIAPTGPNSITFTGATPREYLSLNGESLAAGFYFRASARRKPGTTGAVAQQEVIFTIDSVEVGRFTVQGSDQSVDPICGSIELADPNGDTRFNVTTADIEISVSSADSDLEIFFELVGNT